MVVLGRNYGVRRSLERLESCDQCDDVSFFALMVFFSLVYIWVAFRFWGA